MVPVLMTTIDGVARARRRGHVIWRSLIVVLAAAVPFVLLVGIVLLARLARRASRWRRPARWRPGAVPLSGGGIALLVVMARRADRRIGRGPGARPSSADPHAHVAAASRGPRSDGALAGLLVVMCAVTLSHLAQQPVRRVAAGAGAAPVAVGDQPGSAGPCCRCAWLLIAVGIAPAVLVVGYYANELGYGPINVVWEMVLLLAGHGVSILAALEWSVVLGCLVSAVTLSVLAARGLRAQPAPVTVRGPVTYAGPGSLGGTKSALRR